jgi:hypothetical protein
MSYFENLTCGCQDCHYNHDALCYRESITLDLNGTCEDMVTCDDFECQDCEFFDFCKKEKKYNSTAFTSNEDYYNEDEY